MESPSVHSAFGFRSFHRLFPQVMEGRIHAKDSPEDTLVQHKHITARHGTEVPTLVALLLVWLQTKPGRLAGKLSVCPQPVGWLPVDVCWLTRPRASVLDLAPPPTTSPPKPDAASPVKTPSPDVDAHVQFQSPRA